MGEHAILIVNAAEQSRKLLVKYLQDHSLNIIEVQDGEVAVRTLQQRSPDVILLDEALPGAGERGWCSRIREHSSAPVILTMSRLDNGRIVRALESGVDDYIRMPPARDVLAAKVRAHLRRAVLAPTRRVIRFGQLTLHLDTFEALYRSQAIPFLAKELRLFFFLAERARQVFSPEQLYESIWGHAEGDSRTVMVHISNIRKKLAWHAPDTVFVETVKGLGYRLLPVDPDRLERAAAQEQPTKAAIIQAAADLFAEGGYEGMTMKGIARQVGIRPSQIYQYFKNKDDLFLHIYRDLLNNHLKIALDQAYVSRLPTVWAKLDKLLRSIIEFQFGEASKLKVFVRVLLFPPGYFQQDVKAELNKLERQEFDLLTELFRQGMESGEIRQGDSEHMVKMLLCLMDGFFWEMQRHDELTFLRRFDEVWRQFWELVRAK